MKIRLLACITLWITVAGSALATTPLEDGFADLVEGRVAEARTTFHGVLTGMDEGELGALKGLALTAWAQGEIPGVVEHLAALIERYPDNPMLATWLAASSQTIFQGWPLEDRVATLRAALSRSPNEPNHSLLLDELAMVLDMQMNEEAADAARQAGVLIDHWAMVGPFGKHGQADMRLPFGPEQAWQSSWEGWLRTVETVPVEPVSPVGMIFPEALVYPQHGVVYWFHVVESDKDASAWLNVRCPVGLRMWWNGEPVAEKNESALQTANVVSSRVDLAAGRNLLVLKVPAFANGWFRVLLQPDDSALAVRSVPFEQDEWESTWLKPFEIEHETNHVSQGRVSEFPIEMGDAFNDIHQSERDIWLGLWHLDRQEFAAAIQRFDDARERHPRFWLAHTLYAEACRELARSRPGSRVRLLQNAETAFRTVLENEPDNKNAFIGMLSYQLEMGQVDSAMERMNTTLEAYPDLKSRGYSGMLNYTRAMVLASKNFTAESRQILNDLRDGFLPTLDVYAWLYDGYAEARNHSRAASVIEEAVNTMPVYPAFVQRALSLDDVSLKTVSILDVLKTRMERHPQSIRFALDYGAALESRHHLEDAEAFYQTLATRFPHNEAVQSRLARLYSITGEAEAAMNAYAEWYDIRPRAMEPFRALREGPAERTFPYEEYDAQLGDIDVTEAQRWSDTRASGIYLLDIMVLEIHDDGTYDQYIHQAIQVLNQDGIRRWAEVVIPRGPNVELLQARTITPRGLVWDVFAVQDVGGQQSLSMFGVEPGAIIEYAYLERTGRADPGLNVYSGGYFFGSDNDPMLLSKLTIIRPEGFPFHLDANPEDFVGTETRKDGKIITVWENRLQDGLKEENFAPPLAERVPSLQWTTGRDWMTFVERLRQSLYGVEEESPLLVEHAETLSRGVEDSEALVEAVYEWVRTEIEATSGGQTTLDTFVMRAGSEYGRLMLARQLLRILGIQTHVVAVLDNDEQDGFRPMPFPSYPARVMVLVPEQEGIDEPIAFDFSSRFASLGSLPGHVKKQVALIYDDTVPYLDPLFPELWEQARMEREIHLTLNEDRSASVWANYRYGHGIDMQIRELLTNPEVKDRLVDAQITNDFRGVQVDESSIVAPDDISVWPELAFRGTMPDVVISSGDVLEVNPLLVKTEASGFIREPTREFSVEFSGSPSQDPLRISIDLSEFFGISTTIELPDDVFLLTEFGYYSLFYEWLGSSVVVRRSFLIPPQTIMPDQYSRFTEFCRAIDRLESRAIRIQRNKS